MQNIFEGHDPDNQLRPRINKGDFYFNKGYDLVWLLLEPINIAHSREDDPELTKRFSPAQKLMYFWWYLDAQVSNGGFIQFYYNGYGPYIPAILAGLEYLKDKKMFALVEKAQSIYVQHEDEFNSARATTDLFNSDLYSKMKELSLLDGEYFSLKEKTALRIEKLARKNPSLFCVDEEGNPMPKKYTGICKVYHNNGNLKIQYELDNNKITGNYEHYLDSGQIISREAYVNGEKTKNISRWHENGNISSVQSWDEELNLVREENYYEDGTIREIQYKDNGFSKGPYKSWYPNGQLKEDYPHDKFGTGEGMFHEFYEDGSPKLEAQYEYFDATVHQFWNESGEQLVKDGTGIYTEESMDSSDEISKQVFSFVNYKKHGAQWYYKNNIPEYYREFKTGVKHGKSKSFYNNGNVKEIKIYEDGELISEAQFAKFKDPKIIVTSKPSIANEELKNLGYQMVDQHATPLNLDEIKQIMTEKADISFFQDRDDDFSVYYNSAVVVDAEGSASEATNYVSNNGIYHYIVLEELENLKFAPALKDGMPVDTMYGIKLEFMLGEGND